MFKLKVLKLKVVYIFNYKVVCFFHLSPCFFKFEIQTLSNKKKNDFHT